MVVEAMNTKNEKKNGRKTIQSDLWVAGTPTRLFCCGSSVAPAQTLQERKIITMVVRSILGEDILVMYLLSPLSTMRTNDHGIMPMRTYLRDIARSLDG